MRSPTLLGVLSLVAAVAAPITARADTTASFHNGGGTLTQLQASAMGWEFSVTDFVTISSLGIWDSGSDGLSKVHQVGIFRSDTFSLVVGASIIDGTAAPLIDGSRFVPVAPVTLSPGVLYYILADDFTADPFVSGPNSMGFGPEITWVALANSSGITIHDTPVFTPGTLGNLGPNFRYTVPTPGAASLLGLGSLMVAARRRR